MLLVLFNQFDKGNEVLSFAKENLAHKKQGSKWNIVGNQI